MLDFIFKLFGKIIEYIPSKSKSKRSVQDNTLAIPKHTVKILPIAGRSWWNMGTHGDQPAMQVVFDFDITNITKIDILITGTKLRYPKKAGHVSVRKQDANIYGRYIIPSLTISDGRADYWIYPPIIKENKPFTADVCLIDQFGNEHWVKKIEFKYS